MAESTGERYLLGLYILTYQYSTARGSFGVPHYVVPLYAEGETEAREKAENMCLLIAHRDRKEVVLKSVKTHPQGFTMGGSCYPGRITVDAQGNQILPQHPPFSPPDLSRPC